MVYNKQAYATNIANGYRICHLRANLQEKLKIIVSTILIYDIFKKNSGKDIRQLQNQPKAIEDCCTRQSSTARMKKTGITLTHAQELKLTNLA